MPRVAAAELRRFACEVILALGAAPADAAWTADVIVASELAAHESHGMRRLPEYVERWRAGSLDPSARPVVELDAGAIVRMDGRRALGHVALRDVTDLVVERARVHGIAAVALRRSGQAGRFADFCARGAAAGCAILFFVNDSGGGQDVAPPGGLEMRLATNPIGVGLPRAAEPHLILDMSTSTVARGRVAEELDRGTPIPAAWTTPTGAIRPLGGHKGFGLSLVTEVLAGILTGSGHVGPDPQVDDQGVLAIALDIARLRPVADVVAEVEAMLAYVRDVTLEDGAPPVRVPGESGALATQERLRDGTPVQEFTWQRLLATADALGIPRPVAGTG